MKQRIQLTILPVIAGVASVLLVLLIINLLFHSGDVFRHPDNGFLLTFVPFTLFMAFFIQYWFVLPIRKRFLVQKKVWNHTLFQFTALLCVFSGIAFGWIFRERDLGWTEWFWVSLTGLLAFALYWTVNLLMMNYFELPRIHE